MTDFTSMLQRANQQSSAISMADLNRWNVSMTLPWLEQAGTSTVVECSGCHEGCIMPLQQSPYGGVAVVCDKEQDLGVVPVDAADTQKWQLNMRLFAGVIAAAFNTTTVELVKNRLWYVGTHSSQKLVLFYGSNWPDAAEFLDQQQFKLQQAVLITLYDPPDKLGRLAIPLLDFATISTDGFITVDHDVLAALLPIPQTIIVQHQFKRIGNSWRLVFNGKEAIIKDCTGMRYIAVLLSNPYQAIHATRLQRLNGKTEINDQQFYEPDTLGADHLPQQIHDDQTLKTLQNHYQNLVDTGVEGERLASAKETLLDAYNNQKSAFTDSGNKARNAVSNAINRALKNIKAELPDCAAHLEQSISKGFSFSYEPRNKIPWQ